MKVFIGKKISCDLDYEYLEVLSLLNGKCEIILDEDKVNLADAIVFPTSCAGTLKYISYTISYMDSIIKNKKDTAKVYLMGCLTRQFTKKDEFISIQKWIDENIDYVIPKGENSLIFQYLLNMRLGTDTNNYGISRTLTNNNYSEIYVSSGCLNKCAFCKTTYQNTPLHSMDIVKLKKLIDKANSANIKKLSIRGMNICQYGLDLYKDYRLLEILEYIESKSSIEHIELLGFSFSDAIHNDFSYVLKKCKKPIILAGSLESGSDRILKFMRKGFTSSEFLNFIEEINEFYPKYLDLDIISGYPTETSEDIDLTIELLEQVYPYCIMVNSYKDSPFVDSHSLPQLSTKEKENHMKIYEKKLQKLNSNGDIIINYDY